MAIGGQGGASQAGRLAADMDATRLLVEAPPAHVSIANEARRIAAAQKPADAGQWRGADKSEPTAERVAAELPSKASATDQASGDMENPASRKIASGGVADQREAISSGPLAADATVEQTEDTGENTVGELRDATSEVSAPSDVPPTEKIQGLKARGVQVTFNVGDAASQFAEDPGAVFRRAQEAVGSVVSSAQKLLGKVYSRGGGSVSFCVVAVGALAVAALRIEARRSRVPQIASAGAVPLTTELSEPTRAAVHVMF